jgi:hypothetical protein
MSASAPASNPDLEDAERDYLAALTPKERAALGVARASLGGTFDLRRSNGFLRFVDKRAAAMQPVPGSDSNPPAAAP